MLFFKELKAFLSENMPDFEKKVNSYNGSLKIFNESALFSERGKFVLNRLHEIDDKYNSKFTDTNMYSFPLLSPLTQDATALNKSTPKNIIFAIKSINTIRGIMEGIRETGNKKPVVGFIAGQTAPPGRRMGHAGAIIGGADDTAAAKMRIMRENGILVAESPAEIGATMAKALGVTA
jgi:hypothetical protein